MNEIDFIQPKKTVGKLISIDVLDNIRAEIEDAAFDSQEIDGEHESIMIIDLDDALKIIDKYRQGRK